MSDILEKLPLEKFGLNADQAKKLIRFVLVGGVNTLLYLGLAIGFHEFGLSLDLSHALALFLSLVTSYLGHKIFTFEVKGQHKKSGFRFVIATILIMLTQYGLIVLLKQTHLAANLILLASSAYYPISSFIIHNCWTFRLKTSPQSP
ncbi:GtrA family protein [Hirschia baltica]|uniref:GtrA family protein n=1 Tax=Hirschia baltica (strain ATCC 49814 / DSM 5838 / IFAM 1418) TaxID=582402 RepID=C6XS31_HIRBI|nr:GtrA family protein [Hirschia baltica]ACT60872.1 GtrA family protein [Hirschia baltica ATCC 49814]